MELCFFHRETYHENLLENLNLLFMCVYGAAFAVTFYLPEVGTERAGNDITGPEPDD